MQSPPLLDVGETTIDASRFGETRIVMPFGPAVGTGPAIDGPPVSLPTARAAMAGR